MFLWQLIGKWKSLCLQEWNQKLYEKALEFIIYNLFGRKFHQKNIIQQQPNRVKEPFHVRANKVPGERVTIKHP